MKKSLFNIYTYLILFLNVFVYLWFITHGTFNLFEEENRGSAFDSLGASLVKLDCSVDLKAINIEAFIIGDKAYMYFGAFPAFLRILFNFLFPFLYGKWSRVSCFLAALFCLFVFCLIVHKVLLENESIKPNIKQFIFNISLLAFGLGSPLLFVVSNASIYHEAQLWGFFWSLSGIYFLLFILNNKEKQFFKIFIFSFCSAMAFLSKVTFALPLVIIFFFILLDLLLKYKRKLDVALLFALILPALISLLFSLWYNNCRFGSAFKFMDINYYYFYLLDPALKEIDQTKGQFNLIRIPYALLNYFFLFGPEFLSRNAPYITMPDFVIAVPDLYTFKERPFPLIIVSPWILISTFLGIIFLIKAKDFLFLKLCGCAFFLQFILILSYMCLNHRYSIEFFPFFVFVFSFFLSRLGKDIKLKTHEKKILFFAVFIVLFSVITTVLSTLSWKVDRLSSGAPEEYVYMMKDYFKKVDLFFEKKL